MALPTDGEELERFIERIVIGWKLEHHPQFTILHAVMLGMSMTRNDYNQVVRAYVFANDENKAIKIQNS